MKEGVAIQFADKEIFRRVFEDDGSALMFVSAMQRETYNLLQREVDNDSVPSIFLMRQYLKWWDAKLVYLHSPAKQGYEEELAEMEIDGIVRWNAEVENV